MEVILGLLIMALSIPWKKLEKWMGAEK